MSWLRNLLGSRDEEPARVRAARLTSQGNFLGGEGKLDQAIDCFRRAIAIEKKYPPAYLGLATAYREQGAYDAALQILNSAPSTMDLDLGDEPGALLEGLREEARRAADARFEIAFARVAVLLAKAQRFGAKDSEELLAAVQGALAVGDATAGQPFAGDFKEDHESKLAILRGLLSELS